MKKIYFLILVLLCLNIGVKAQQYLLQEGFEGDSIPGWTLIDNDGDGSNWYILHNSQSSSGGFVVHSGEGHITSASWVSTGALTPDNWLITPPITLSSNAVLSFWAAGQDQGWSAEHFSVYISTTGSDVSDFTTNDPLLYDQVATGVMTQHTIYLDQYTGQTVYIAFRHHNITDMFRLNLDDIEITTAPTEPTITATPTSMNFNAWLGYTEDMPVTVAAINLTANVTASTSAPFSLSTDSINFSNTVTISQNGGLLYVRYTPTTIGTDNGDISLTSPGASTVTIPLEGHAVMLGSVPYTQDFEDEDGDENINWWFYHNGVNQWNIGTAVNATPEGENALYVSDDNGVSNSYDNTTASTTWAYRDIDFGNYAEYSLSFKFKVQGESSSYDWMKVYLGPPAQVQNSAQSSGATIQGASLIGTFVNQPSWTTITATLPSSFSGVQRLYFLWWNDGTGGTNPPAAVDDIVITGTNCGKTGAPVVQNVTAYTADVTFLPALETDYTWEYALCAEGESPNDVVTIAVYDTSFTITDLNPATTYTLYIRTVCDDGEVSNWSNPTSFTTNCVSLVITDDNAFLENFNALTSGIPNCWDNSEGTTTTESYKWNYNASGEDGACVMFNSYSNSTGNTNMLKTPVLDLSALSTVLVSFSYKNATGGDFSVFLSTDGGNTYPTTIATNLTGASSWTPVEYILPEMDDASNVVIVFKGTSNYGSGSAYIYLDNIYIGKAPTCPKPQNLSTISITSDEAVIGWTGSDEISTYNVAISTHPNFNPDTCTEIDFTYTNSYQFNNLNSNTTYYVAVQADCGGDLSIWSNIHSFTTTTIPAEVPYYHDFEDGEENGQWVLVNGTQTNKWYIGQPSGESDSVLFISQNGTSTSYSISSASNVWVYRDFAFGDGAEFTLSFRWKAKAESCCDYLKAYIGNPNAVEAGSTTVPEGAIQLNGTMNNQDNWQYFSATFDGSYANTSKRLYFLWHNDSSLGDAPAAVVDSIEISTSICGRPYDITLLEISENTADISFNPASANDVAWQYVYATGTFTPDDNYTPEDITDTLIELTNLIANTQYSIYVRTSCDNGEYSAWSEILTFRTACSSITDLPYTDNFDTYGTGTDIYPPCWFRINTYTSGDRPYISSTSYQGAGAMYFQTGTSGTYNMAITPEFDESIELNTLQATFMYKGSYTSDRLIVGVISNPIDISTFVPIDTVYPDANSATTWIEKEVNFSSYEGEAHYIAFLNQYTTTYAYGYMDNLVISLIPACPKPHDLTVTDVSENSVTLSWTPVGEENEWEIIYGAPGFDIETEGTTIQNVNTNPFTVTGLDATTSYEFYLRASCGGGEFSLWSLSVSHSTSMIAVDIPYTTDFSVADWKLNNGTCTNKWKIGIPDGDNDNALFITNDNSSAGYTITSLSVVSAEKLFNVTDAEFINISFDVTCGGESSWDYLKVFFAPSTTEYEPNASSAPGYAAYGYSTDAMNFEDYLSQTTGSTGSSYIYKLNLTQGTLHISENMPNPAPNGLAKLVFLWKNDTSVGTQPGAIIRNVAVNEAGEVSIEDISMSSNSITLMPNPADNYIELHVNSNMNMKEAVVYNISGQAIQTVVLTDNHARIDLSGMASGMYFVRVSGDKVVATKKFIKR